MFAFIRFGKNLVAIEKIAKKYDFLQTMFVKF